MNKVWTLNPKRAPVYGQDYFINGLKTKLQGKNIFILESPYTVDDVKDGDIVVTHNPDDKKEYEFIKKLISKYQIVLVTHIHCHPSYYDNSIQVKELLELSDHLVCPFNYIDNDWFGDKNVDATPNAISSTEFQSSEKCPYGWANGSPLVIGHVGRIDSAKGQQLLAALASSLKQLQAKLVLQFPPKEIYLSRAIAIQAIDPVRIYLHPDINRNSLRPVRWFDICLSFSLSEFAPLVVLESLMAGTPVVATDSTTFYDELKSNFEGNLSHAINTVILPSRLNRGNVPRSELMLSCDEVFSANHDIVCSIQKVLLWQNNYAGNLRDALSNYMKESLYEADNAYDKCIDLYCSYLQPGGKPDRKKLGGASRG